MTASELELRVLSNLEPHLQTMADRIEASLVEHSAASYTELAEDLSCGVVVDSDYCQRILASSGKTKLDLQADLGGVPLVDGEDAGGARGWRVAAEQEPSTAQEILSQVKRLLRLA